MVLGAGIMVKLVLIILLAFSVLSWAIIIYKYSIIRKMERESIAFLDFFWSKKQFTPIFEACVDYKFTPLSRLFAAGYNELMQVRIPKKDTALSQFNVGEFDSIQRSLKKTMSNEISRMEKAVAFLATTGNTTPFIGLFGTVWGIMNSFRGIGLKGSASLAVVAPGISEALIATAMGLIAAIPAVVAYNHFVTRINRMAVEMENFAGDFLNIVERELRKEKG
ncbi:MAG: protein TolQ [Deltaproteobacteria bacterium RIFCSPLOWO2_12_FULL_43_16]|nr:MAG: protein TolQ [Deltaproteobacteria bacterium GWA2_43_19]OGQ13145.1 MAG: protein TolQ [Deltaproteobacteria bacterium RIFCSPHIGHO2_02_FULL_43_33]OGQ57418.1 MAG: protein TolQ [Deltaproteobacteria bacterium RIFCSPLOWO2_12_FULL_43_16]HBR16973.1 protein TolQ [Deltaproteobacteria bacterium]